MFKHYTMDQIVLPLNLERKLQENDIAYAVNELVETIPEEAFACIFQWTSAKQMRIYLHSIQSWYHQ